MHSYFYTMQEEQWLIENVDKFVNGIELTEAFNLRFGKSKNAFSIKSKKRFLLPEHKYGWSGGKCVGEGSSTTAVPIGTESWKGGYLWVKIADFPLPKNFTSADRKKNWIQKHRLIYEKAYGEVPKKSIIVFLDQNRHNFELTNLYCINREIQTVMMRNGWYSSNPELTLTAIKWAELFYTLKK